MYAFGKPLVRKWAWHALAAIALSWATPVVHAAVMLVPDPEVPTDAVVATVDPLSTAEFNARAVIGERQLRQTFQNPTEFVVGEIRLSLDLNGADGGLVLDIFEVADVNAGTWEPLGEAIESIVLDTSVDLPGTAERLGLELTSANLFTLPARNTGTEGYGIQVSNFDQSTNIGLFRHSNDGTDHYPSGVFYTESGGQSSATRDLGVWLLESTIEPPLAGDTNDDGVVDLEDLVPIRSNFLQSVTERLEGDLNGDGLVDTVDFRQWKSAFLGSGGSLAAADLGFLTAVPEPATAGLLLLAGLAAGGIRAYRRRNIS